jgi:hypothetical protein
MSALRSKERNTPQESQRQSVCCWKCTLSGLKLVMVSHCLHLGSVCHSVTTMYPDIRHGVTVPARQQRVQSKLVQQARMELALREGLRLVVDCSFIAACSAQEVRAVELPQDSAAACPQICHQPRTLLQPKCVMLHRRCAVWQSSCSSVWQSIGVLCGPQP